MVTIVSISPRSSSAQKDAPDLAALASQYNARTLAYTRVETTNFPTEKALFDHLERRKGRTSPVLVALDSRGKALSSEQFAGWIAEQRDSGRQELIFAIGPANGWSAAARARAALLLSFGPMTFPHGLMRVIVAEQIYRAFTILAGHPYHSGHAG